MLCAAFARRDHQGTADFSVKFGFRGPEGIGGASHMRHHTGCVISVAAAACSWTTIENGLTLYTDFEFVGVFPGSVVAPDPPKAKNAEYFR